MRISTTRYETSWVARYRHRELMGWAGLRNGELLQAAEASFIDVLLTGDQTLVYEQNMAGRRIAIVALSAIRLPILLQNLSLIIAALDNAAPGSYQTVNCGTFSRKKDRHE